MEPQTLTVRNAISGKEKQLKIALFRKAGETAVLADLAGAGIIQRMWLSGTIPRNEAQRLLAVRGRLRVAVQFIQNPGVAAPYDFLVVHHEDARFRVHVVILHS